MDSCDLRRLYSDERRCNEAGVVRGSCIFFFFFFFFNQTTCEGQVQTAVRKEVISGLHLFLTNACFQLLDHEPEVENEPPPVFPAYLQGRWNRLVPAPRRSYLMFTLSEIFKPER